MNQLADEMKMFIGTKVGFHITSRIAGRSITASPPPISIDCESNKGKHVYLCFSELFRPSYSIKVVRSFPSFDVCNEEERPVELGCIAATRPQTVAFGQPCIPWTRSGHKILHYCSGQQCISWIDTSQRRIRFEHSTQTKTDIKSFITVKDDIVWGEIDGKLYCINSGSDWWQYKNKRPKSERENLFEVLDPAEKTKNADWRPLARPPHILLHRNEVRYHRALFLEGSKKIVAWQCEQPITCCFDVTRPENGWKELPYDIRPHGARPFVIHHQNHPVLGDFNLLFSYQPCSENPLLISPFYMSNDCQSFQAIKNSPIQLPKLCLDYLSNRYTGIAAERMYELISCGAFEFVNMGDQKFGFMLNKVNYYDPVYWPDTKQYEGRPAGLLFLTYKYDVVVVNNDLEIRSSLIGIRHFRYRSKIDGNSNTYVTGAFNM